MFLRNVVLSSWALCHAVVQVSSTRAVLETSGDKSFPVRKVIDLLKKMQAELTQDAANDEAIMDKMDCWCVTNRKEKTESIVTAQKQIVDLQDAQASHAALAKANTKAIEKRNAEIAKDQQSLDEAIEIRNKEAAAFTKEEQDTVEYVKALEAAVEVLKKHQSFLQKPAAEVKAIAQTISNAMLRRADFLASLLTESQRQKASSFVQSLSGDHSDATPTFRTKYNTQSGEIFGILQQMLDNFRSTLSAAQKDEMAAQQAYAELKAAKEAQIQAAQEDRKRLHEELTAADLTVVESKEAREETQASLAADQKFLKDLEATCASTDEEHKKRIAAREQEVEAVAKAIEVLDSDESHDLFSKSFNPSMLQTDAQVDATSRAEASRLLFGTARRQRDPRLAALAVQVRLDSFTKVKQAIQVMIDQLTKDSADEVKHKDWCNTGLNSNQADTETAVRAHGEANRTIDGLNATLAETRSEIEALHQAVKAMTTAIERAGENREKENAVFQVEVREQKDAQVVLKKALDVLVKVFGAPSRDTSLVQVKPAAPAAPAGFEEYTQNAGSSKVITLIQKIIGEAKAEETELHKDEVEAQTGYENWVKDTNDDVTESRRLLVVKGGFAAETTKRLSAKIEDRTQIREEEDNLNAEKADLEKSCDYILKNFDVRQKARQEEVQALNDALRVLSGATLQA